MANVLVTGGAGFIGTHLVKALLESGHSLVVLDDLSNGKRENVPHGPKMTFIQGDVADVATVRKAMEGCDHVVHLAAMVSIPASVEQPQKAFMSNVVGTQNLLEVAREMKLTGHFIYTSSAAVYAGLDKPRAAEADAYGRTLMSPYATSKMAVESFGRLYRDVYGLKVVGLRLFNVYGPGQDAANAYSGVLNQVVHSVETGSLLQIFGDGNQTRDFVAVWDVVGVIRALVNRPLEVTVPHIMNLGSGIPVSILDVIRQVVALKRVNPRVEYRPSRNGDAKLSSADITLLKQVLPGWQPMPLGVGLRGWLL